MATAEKLERSNQEILKKTKEENEKDETQRMSALKKQREHAQDQIEKVDDAKVEIGNLVKQVKEAATINADKEVKQAEIKVKEKERDMARQEMINEA